MKNNHQSCIRNSMILAAACLGLLASTAVAEVKVMAPMAFPIDSSAPLEESPRMPELLKSVRPEYPAELLESKLEERVFVVFVVDSKGCVKRAKAVLGSHAPFEKAAVDAIEKWEFKPGSIFNHPVNTQMYVEVTFKP